MHGFLKTEWLLSVCLGVLCVQGFSGGNDPNNREPLWPTNFPTTGDLFTYLQTVIAFRKTSQVWTEAQVRVLLVCVCQWCAVLAAGAQRVGVWAAG